MLRRLAGLALLAAAWIGWGQPSPRSVWDGVYSEAQAERGREAYAGQCARCHGTDLLGGESAPPLVGFEFSANWNGLTLGDLFERIRISMPADAPGRLSREENAAIISLILQMSDMPPGETELDARREALNAIALEMYPPDSK